MNLKIKILMLLVLALFFSCGGEKEKPLEKIKDTLAVKQNPLHLPDSVAAKMGNIKIDEDSVFLDFSFIAFDNFIVLSSEVDTVWAEGKPEGFMNGEGGVFAVVTEVNLKTLPKIYLDLLKKKIRVYSADNNYAAKITGFKLLSAYIPHFAEVQTWNGANGEAAYRTEQKNQAIWNNAALYLVAEFETDEKKNDDFYFAVPENDSLPFLFSMSNKNPITKQIKTLAAKTEEYKSIQQDYLQGAANKKLNWNEDETASSEFISFSGKDQIVYSVLSEVSGNPCGGDFSAEKFSIWKTTKDGKSVLLFMKDVFWKVLLCVDTDSDGIPEFLVEDNFGRRLLFKSVNGEWVEYLTWEIPYQDCGC